MASGLEAAAGLYGAIAVGFFAAVFGGTRLPDIRPHTFNDCRHGDPFVALANVQIFGN